MLTYTTPILNEMAEFRHWIAWNAGAVAAKQMGRNYIGAEIDSYYQRISQEKMDEATATKVGDAYASIHLDKIVSIRDCDIREGLHCQPRAS
jgi:hypothetical protein